MSTRIAIRRAVLLTAGLAAAGALALWIQRFSNSPEEEREHAPDATVFPFQVHWPLRVDSQPHARPLLLGELHIRPDTSDSDNPRAQLHMELIRPDDEQHREYWNDCLMYRQYGWMRRVRVWDEDERWLYPNLAYLFKLHGIDRLRRYGGWDPGHQVDNDFGAILIRKFDAGGEAESSATEAAPLVSAGWEPVGVKSWDRQTVVHRIRSDAFTVSLQPGESGRCKVWFVYADFMEHDPPPDWPDQPEFEGGTMAFFQVDWKLTPGDSPRFAVEQQIPPPTGFDWRTWVDRFEQSASPRGDARLAE